MGKKTKKKSSASGRRSRTKSISVTRYFFIGLSVVLLVFALKIVGRPIDKPFVLGTSVYLASDGDYSNSGTSNTEIQTSTNTPSETTITNPTPEIKPIPRPTGFSTEHPETIYVDCVGPDGKHFQTNLKACADLNHSFHNDHFLFTILKPDTTKPKPEIPKPQESSNSAGIRMQQIKIGEKGKVSIDQTRLRKKLENKDSRIEFNSKDGTTSAKIKMPDGTESDLDEQVAIDEVNKQLESIGVDISKTESKDFSIKKNNVRAKTHFPLSINPETKELTVTTPTGAKVVSVLPDEAVQRAFLTGKINSSESESPTASASGQIATDTTTLTTLNNEPVFKVNGFSNKKAFGFIPVSFAKSIFVSATDGKIIKTDETFTSKLLEAISF